MPLIKIFLLLSLFACSKPCCKNNHNKQQENITTNQDVHTLVIFTGASGSGKTTMAQRLKEEFNIPQSVSCTTRDPRGGEVDGEDYYFLSQEEFTSMIKNNRFIEWSMHFGNFYGLKRDEFDKLKNSNLIVVTNFKAAEAINKPSKNANRKLLKILLVADNKTLVNRIESRKQKMSKKELDSRVKEFEEINSADKGEYKVINTKNKTPDQVYLEVKQAYMDIAQ